MWDNFVSGVNEIANKIFSVILLLLPDSPFKDFKLPEGLESFLGYLNYYIPFSTIVSIGLSWVTCIGVYYIYQLILRNIRAIK